MPTLPARELAIGEPIIPKPYAKKIKEIVFNDNKNGGSAK